MLADLGEKRRVHAPNFTPGEAKNPLTGIVLKSSKYPPAKPGALVCEPHEAA